MAGWLQRHADRPFADVVSAQPAVCAAGRAPKQAGTPEYAAVANYGYHFDAGKFGVQLREHAVANLHVRHVLDDVDEVLSHENGDIAALRTRAHGDIDGDLFIDCSGLASVLLGQHFGIGVRSQKHLLFNDTRAGAAGALRHARRAHRLRDHLHRQPCRLDLGHRPAHAARHRLRVFQRAHPTTRPPSARCWPTCERTGGPADLPAAAAQLRSTPATASVSGTATAWPWACRPASSSRWRRRRWRWWNCRPR